LQSLKHCRIGDPPPAPADSGQLSLPLIAHELRPKIYNGRAVPNCFPPSEEEKPLAGNLSTHLVIQQQQQQLSNCRKVGPPPPPKRSQTTQLTSPT